MTYNGKYYSGTFGNSVNQKHYINFRPVFNWNTVEGYNICVDNQPLKAGDDTLIMSVEDFKKYNNFNEALNSFEGAYLSNWSEVTGAVTPKLNIAVVNDDVISVPTENSFYPANFASQNDEGSYNLSIPPWQSVKTTFKVNASKVFVFDDYHGEYKDLGDPCIDDTYRITFNSQITCVLKVSNKDLWIACADRWMPYDWVPDKAADTVKEFEKGFKDYVPDLSPRTSQPLAGVECRHYENTCESRYVWLPVEWDDDKPVLRWYDEWRIEDLI